MKAFRLVASFELIQRLKKRSFWIITFLGPLLYVLLMSIPALLAVSTIKETTVHVYDESGYFATALSKKKLTDLRVATVPDKATFERLRKALINSDDDVLLHIKPMADVMEDPVIEVVSKKELGQQAIRTLTTTLKEMLRRRRAAAMGLAPGQLEKLSPRIHIQQRIVTESGTKKTQAGLSFALAMVASILIYIALSAYGGMVLNSVQEEKQNRLVEVILLSVRPFELMLGKIVGIGMVGILQYILWGVMIFVISLVGGLVLGFSIVGSPEMSSMAAGSMGQAASPEVQQLMEAVHYAIHEVNWTLIVTSIVLYFIGGFFIYAALYAAVGAAVDDPRDAQMFIFPLILPVLLSFISVMTTLNISPHSGAIFWMSMIPLTSPVAMVARIPFGVEWWEIALSLMLLMATAVFMVWVAGRVFRVGLLMYGTKPTWKTLWKWVRTA